MLHMPWCCFDWCLFVQLAIHAQTLWKWKEVVAFLHVCSFWGLHSRLASNLNGCNFVGATLPCCCHAAKVQHYGRTWALESNCQLKSLWELWGSVRWGKPCLQFGWVDQCSNWTLTSNCNVQLPCSNYFRERCHHGQCLLKAKMLRCITTEAMHATSVPSNLSFQNKAQLVSSSWSRCCPKSSLHARSHQR